MATTITKTKSRAKEAPAILKTKQSAGGLLADEYGRAQEAVKAMEPTVNAFTKTADKLKAFVKANYADTEEAKLTGDLYELQIGGCAKAPAKVKEGGFARVRELLTEETFMKLVKINLEDLRAYLTPEQLAEVLEADVGYTEKRKINVSKVQ